MAVASPKGAMIAFEDIAKFAIGISVFVLDRVTMFALRLKSWSFVGWLVGIGISAAGIVLTLWPHIQLDFSGAFDPPSPFSGFDRHNQRRCSTS
jgi:hypothetical protein